jgi:hypothetical protein
MSANERRPTGAASEADEAGPTVPPAPDTTPDHAEPVPLPLRSPRREWP